MIQGRYHEADNARVGPQAMRTAAGGGVCLAAAFDFNRKRSLFHDTSEKPHS